MKQEFKFEETKLKGAYQIHPFFSPDHRGGLLKDYNVDVFSAHGIDGEVRETFYTTSKKGVIRAIHFQLVKQQAKLVRCVKGRTYDVIVDLRIESETFGQWVGIELSESNMRQLYVPERFGHGYLVLEDSIVSYKCFDVFFAEGDSGIMYNDPEIGIVWPFEEIGGIENMIISQKDLSLMSFSDYKKGIKANETQD